MRRCVVTGYGVVSCLGNEVDTFWHNIILGKSGIKYVDEINALGAPVDIDTLNHDIDPRTVRKIDRTTLFAMHAAQKALEDSGYVAETEAQRERSGISIGSTLAGLRSLQDSFTNTRDGRHMDPYTVSRSLNSSVSAFVSIRHGFKGPALNVSSACASGSQAIGEAFRKIQHNEADVMIAGGSESTLIQYAYNGFKATKAVTTSKDPETASRPFDIGHSGFVMGEGAGILILEEYEHAKARGAEIYAEIVGYGNTNDAYKSEIPPEDGSGLLRAMQKACDDAGIRPAKIDLINAHATSTVVGDRAEAIAISNFLAGTPKDAAVTSNKGSIGHTLGAAGAIESILAVLSLQTGIVPGNIHLGTPIQEAAELNLVGPKAINKKIKYVLKNSLGFGGINVSLVFKKHLTWF